MNSVIIFMRQKMTLNVPDSNVTWTVLTTNFSNNINATCGKREERQKRNE